MPDAHECGYGKRHRDDAGPAGLVLLNLIKAAEGSYRQADPMTLNAYGENASLKSCCPFRLCSLEVCASAPHETADGV